MMAQKKSSIDYYLVLATGAVLFVLGAICIYGMISFKLAAVHELAPAARLAHMECMNQIVAPWVVALLLLLGVCIPKRLLPSAWLYRFGAVLLLLAIAVSLWAGLLTGLLVVLGAALALQVVVLLLALGGSGRLHFQKKGYWVRLGSALVHLGFILFVLDLFFSRQPLLHLVLFWITTGATFLGLLFCFYADAVAGLSRRRSGSNHLESGTGSSTG